LNSGPQLAGNTATGVSPPFSTTPTLVSSPIATTESAARRWSAASGMWTGMGGLPITPSLMVYGSGSSGGSSGSFLNPHGISATGRFTVGQGYISTYNSSAGTTISANSFQWRGWVWDADGNGGAGVMRVLPSPFRTSSNTWRRRTCTAYAVSADGTVIAGAQEHNVSTGATSPDPDGSRPVVWTWNAGTNSYDMTYLPNGVNGSGFPYSISLSAGTMHMNSAGTIIVSRAVDNSGNAFIGKWVWNAGTSSWDPPINLGSNLTSQASWLPGSVLSCGVPPTLSPTGVSEDGSVVVGMATYSTCGSFMSGGFIWTAQDGIMYDWYDYLSALGTAGVAPGGFYGPIGDNGNTAAGLPRLGFPTGISADGQAVVGFQGGTQRIPGAVPWVVNLAGGTPCIGPTVTLNPSATVNFSACGTGVILNAGAMGTGPFSYQWYKNGQPLTNGTTPWGSNITGADDYQLRVNAPLTSDDQGTYYCVIAGPCGSPVTTTSSTVQLDPAFPQAPNDTCATAMAVGEGVFNFAPCGAYVNDPPFVTCAANTGNDVWFEYTPTFTGYARVQTCGSSFNTVLTAYAGCGGAEIACNDNYDVGAVSGCSSTRSRISRMFVQQGVPVLIRVGAVGSQFGTPTGQVEILAAPAAPVNDDCAGAITIDAGTTPFDLTEATSDFTPVTCQPAAGSVRDLWFRLVPGCDGLYRIDTCGSGITNPIITVFDQCGGTEIACNDNVGSGVSGCTSNQARVLNVPARAGSPVMIRVAISGTSVPSNLAGVLNVVKTGCLPDLNDDGNVDQDDVGYLINVVAGGDNPTGINADFNCDGNVDQDDVTAIINTIGGGGCP
jgi:hypothetical protein